MPKKKPSPPAPDAKAPDPKAADPKAADHPCESELRRCDICRAAPGSTQLLLGALPPTGEPELFEPEPSLLSICPLCARAIIQLGAGSGAGIKAMLAVRSALEGEPV